MPYISGDPCISWEKGFSQILVANQRSFHRTGLRARTGQVGVQISEKSPSAAASSLLQQTRNKGAISHPVTLQWPAIVTHPQAIRMNPPLLISILSAVECCGHADTAPKTLLASAGAAFNDNYCMYRSDTGHWEAVVAGMLLLLSQLL